MVAAAAVESSLSAPRSTAAGHAANCGLPTIAAGAGGGPNKMTVDVPTQLRSSPRSVH